MQQPTLRKKPLERAIAVAMGVATASPGLAQEAAGTSQEIEEIVVTGIRAS